MIDPATTDSRFTSVGTDAVKRFVRPVCFQNFPEPLLPEDVAETIYWVATLPARVNINSIELMPLIFADREQVPRC